MISIDFFEDLRAKALSIGFGDMRAIAYAPVSEAFEIFYKNFLKKKYHADLEYLENTRAKFFPSEIHADVCSIFVFAHPYRHKVTEKYLRRGKYKIARYAWGRDYHKSLKAKMKKVLEGLPVRLVVDSTPLPERYYARLAGIGKIGKNGMLINKKMGSWFLLSFALCSKELSLDLISQSQKEFFSIDQEMNTVCKDCRLCIDSCPEGALRGNGEMIIEKCISYKTIEKPKKEHRFARKHRYVFGCDICQNVCPYNKGAKGFTQEDFFSPREIAIKISQGEVPPSNDPLWHGSPLKRAQEIGILSSLKNLP